MTSDHDEASMALKRSMMMLGVGLPVFFGLFLFLAAGTWDWPRGWLFVLVFLAAVLVMALYLWRVNPEIYVARSRFRKGSKRWDIVLLALLMPVMTAIFPVAALDDARFHWLPMPWWVCAVGYVALAAGLLVSTWAEGVNKFFEPTVRIQADRGQHVIDSGPYAIVRHPGYAGACLLLVGCALCLGSLWALVPAAASALLLLVRTRWEDETLQAELSGYKEYAQRVRYKWVPGVW
jgi:protein-S-isoprenylcysteine O-methyltransferase Ste14